MAIGNPPKRAKIEKIAVENYIISSPSKIASSFNDFLAGVLRKIVNVIPKTDVSPLSFLPPNNFPQFEFTSTSQAEVVAVIRGMQSKSSTDLDNISI
jgi:hypothetical protein